jgi:hypothetical protein
MVSIAFHPKAASSTLPVDCQPWLIDPGRAQYRPATHSFKPAPARSGDPGSKFVAATPASIKDDKRQNGRPFWFEEASLS